MANTKSAKKRSRQAIRRNKRNTSVLNSVKSAIKDARAAKSGSKGKAADVNSAIKLAVSRIMKAASKGVLHKRSAARYVSRLTTRITKSPAQK